MRYPYRLVDASMCLKSGNSNAGPADFFFLLLGDFSTNGNSCMDGLRIPWINSQTVWGFLIGLSVRKGETQVEPWF
jgi:hypothetical protein